MTIGDLLEVFAENYGLARESLACAMHAAQAMRRVIAHSLGLWRVKKAGEGPRGIAPGDRYADTERIEALPLTVLDADLANGYFKARIPDGRRMERRREHVSIVKDFNSACEVLSDTARESIYRGRIELPPKWLEFKNYPRPKLPAAEPEPFTVEQFEALVTSAESLRETEPRLWLLARIARQTGLRCGSLRELRADWVTEVHGQHYLFVSVVKGGTRGYPVKIQPATAALIREAAPDGGFVFGETPAERERLVNERHTAFMRSIAGSPERGHQQAHRLRDTLATAVLSIYKMDTSRASAALGHASPGALKHYAQWPRECSPLMLSEFAAFLG